MSDIPERTSAREIRPARSGLDATVRVPGSKSITNRALLLAALAGGSSTLRGALAADDTRAFAAGLRALGFAVDEATAGAWRVQGAAGRIPAAEADVFCAEAGTAARFLLAAVRRRRGPLPDGRGAPAAAPAARAAPRGAALPRERAPSLRTPSACR